jgi:hypothetical protein
MVHGEFARTGAAITEMTVVAPTVREHLLANLAKTMRPDENARVLKKLAVRVRHERATASRSVGALWLAQEVALLQADKQPVSITVHKKPVMQPLQHQNLAL